MSNNFEEKEKWSRKEAPKEFEKIKQNFLNGKIEDSEYNQQLNNLLSKIYYEINEDDFTNLNQNLTSKIIKEQLKNLREQTLYLGSNKISEEEFRNEVKKIPLETDSPFEFDIVNSLYYSFLREYMSNNQLDEKELRENLLKLKNEYPQSKSSNFLNFAISRSKKREKNNYKTKENFDMQYKYLLFQLKNNEIKEHEFRENLYKFVENGDVNFIKSIDLIISIEKSFLREFENSNELFSLSQINRFFKEFSPKSKDLLFDKYLDLLIKNIKLNPEKFKGTNLSPFRLSFPNLIPKIEKVQIEIKNIEKIKNKNNETNLEDKIWNLKEKINKDISEKEFRNELEKMIDIFPNEKTKIQLEILTSFKKEIDDNLELYFKLKKYANKLGKGTVRDEFINEIFAALIRNREKTINLGMSKKYANKEYETEMKSLIKDFPDKEKEILKEIKLITNLGELKVSSKNNKNVR